MSNKKYKLIMGKFKRVNIGNVNGTRVSRTKKKRVGNYRITIGKEYWDSDIGSIRLLCYTDGEHMGTMGAITRHLSRKWIQAVQAVPMLDEMDPKIIFVPEPMESVMRGSGQTVLVTQFYLEGLGDKLDEVVWEIIEDCMIDCIESSDLIILDK